MIGWNVWLSGGRVVLLGKVIKEIEEKSQIYFSALRKC
jgi:hypothetical protein